MRSILQDLYYALRQLRKSPGFTFTAITVLALGLGANVAVFTVLNGILLRPLPYSNPDRIVKIEMAGVLPYYVMSYANMVQLRDAMGATLKTGETFDRTMASIDAPGGHLQAEYLTVGADLFPMLGVQPMLGRVFRDDENQPGHEGVILIGNDVWKKFYASDPNIVGKTMTIRGNAYTIVGVMPRGFSFPFGESMQVWSPQALTSANRTAMSGDAQVIGDMFARLPDGMAETQLTAALNRAQSIIAKEVPGQDVAPQVKVTGYQRLLNQEVRKPLWLLYVVVIGIWALACLNLTSLMLARAVSRTREHAVRSALGASRVRLVQQALIESLLVSIAGAAVGLLLAEGAIFILSRRIEQALPVKNTVHLDWRVIALLALLSFVTAMIAGIYPAMRAMRRSVREALHGTTTAGSKKQNRAREVLVVGQLALTLVFLVGAGLFLRTIHVLRMTPLGFCQQNVLTGGIVLNYSMLHRNDKDVQGNVIRTAYLPLLERVQAIPGVKVAALSSVLPLRSEFTVTVMGFLDHKHADGAQPPQADGRLASPGLVDALGIPMIRGRFFSNDDTATSPPVVVVNQAFVNKYLPGQDPIGHIFKMGKGRFAEMRIVGVIGNVKQRSVIDPTKPEIYFCLAQMEPGTPLYGITGLMQVAIRAAVPAGTLRAQFDKALHEVAPDATTTNVKTIHEAVEDSFGSQTLIAQLLEGFAALALMIASIGLYGLLSFAVAQRTREIGVRMALGAQQGNILRLVLRRAMLLASIGLACGGAMAWFATRFAKSYIYGVEPHDALTFGVVALVLALAAILAAWLPARRAASVDPILALRSE